MGVNSLPKTVTRQRRDCDLNPGPSAPESSTLTTRLPSHPRSYLTTNRYRSSGGERLSVTAAIAHLPHLERSAYHARLRVVKQVRVFGRVHLHRRRTKGRL